MQHELKLWDFIAAADFEIPCPPTSEAARGHSRRLWRWLKCDVLARPKKDESSASTQWQIPSAVELDAAVIEPDWGKAASALSTELNGWFDESPDHCSVRVLVGPAGSGVASVLHALARERQLKVLAPPPPHAILDDFDAHKLVLQSLDESADELLVIPNLERFYLRHEDGMTLVRSITERLMSRHRVLLGCDGWAWAFLQQAIGIEDTLGEPMTVAPFSDQRLDAWFRASYDLHEIEFRRSHDDGPVFPPRSDQSASDTKEPRPETSVLIKSLAARARGNLGVALALWRSSLRTRGPDSSESEPAEQTSQWIIWVESPSELQLPKLSTDVDQLHRFVLHAILLHGGLSISMLVTLLPFSREDIFRRVSELRTAGVLHQQNDTFRVTLTAYPEVRQALIGEGFLSDAF